jgi:DNA adenine methylase
MAIVSGYACDLYDKELYPDWKTDTRQVYADGGKKRTEKIWMNPACSQAMVQKSLF